MWGNTHLMLQDCTPTVTRHVLDISVLYSFNQKQICSIILRIWKRPSNTFSRFLKHETRSSNADHPKANKTPNIPRSKTISRCISPEQTARKKQNQNANLKCIRPAIGLFLAHSSCVTRQTEPLNPKLLPGY